MSRLFGLRLALSERLCRSAKVETLDIDLQTYHATRYPIESVHRNSCGGLSKSTNTQQVFVGVVCTVVLYA